jgi:hypothetical protein
VPLTVRSLWVGPGPQTTAERATAVGLEDLQGSAGLCHGAGQRKTFLKGQFLPITEGLLQRFQSLESGSGVLNAYRRSGATSSREKLPEVFLSALAFSRPPH